MTRSADDPASGLAANRPGSIDWGAAWQSARELSGRRGGREVWDRRAPSFARNASKSGYVERMLELMGLEPEAVEERLDELLEELHIAHLRDAPALSLSGGERRRVEICRALATRPVFILLDEPFAGVDPIAVLDIQRIIRFLRERGIGVLITDHNVRETLGICDRAYIINEGSVLASGKPEEIVYNENVRRVYLGEHFRL